MDIFEFAMQMEKDGETYYRELAVKAEHKGIKNILTFLADAEVMHYKVFSSMKAGGKVRPADLAGLSGVKNIFLKMKEEKDVSGLNVSQVALYRKAQEIEKKSEDFYTEKAQELNDAAQKQTLLAIAGQEKAHYRILEKIIDFVSRPQMWLEDPEWYHLEEY